MTTKATTTNTTAQPENTYWHFLNADKRLRYSDKREVVVGETLTVEGEIELCYNGLHASKRAIDALAHAPGTVACLVTLGGTVFHGNDKSVASERTALWIFDAEKLLREFGCTIAENALLAERTAGREPDPRSFAAIETTRQWIKGEATDEERKAAERAAWVAEQKAALMETLGATEYPHPAKWYAATGAAQAAGYTAAIDATYAAAEAAYAAVSAIKNLKRSFGRNAKQAAAEAAQNKMLTSLLMTEYAKAHSVTNPLSH